MGKPKEMSCGEIVRSYREAADKKVQVKVLAELNLCSQREIIEILIANGVKPQELPRQRKKNKAPAEIVREVKKYEASKKDDLIREALTMMRANVMREIENFRVEYETIMMELEGKLSQIDAILGKE